jgi:hypothetical protein
MSVTYIANEHLCPQRDEHDLWKNYFCHDNVPVCGPMEQTSSVFFFPMRLGLDPGDPSSQPNYAYATLVSRQTDGQLCYINIYRKFSFLYISVKNKNSKSNKQQSPSSQNINQCVGLPWLMATHCVIRTMIADTHFLPFSRRRDRYEVRLQRNCSFSKRTTSRIVQEGCLFRKYSCISELRHNLFV